MLVIACVAIIVVGPKDLPAMLRTFGKTIGSIKRMAGDFQRQFNDAIKEADLDEVKDLTSTKGFAPLEDAKRSMEELTRSMNETVQSEPATRTEASNPPDGPAEETKAKPVVAKKPATGKKPAAKKAAPSKSKAAASTSAKAPATKASTAKKPAARKKTTTAKAGAKSPS